MEEPNTTTTTTTTNEPTSPTDYIEAIKKIKENTVDKAMYDAKVAENKELLEALVQGKTIQPEEKPPVDINTLRNELYGSDTANLSNLEFITKTLELRKAIMDEGGADPFLPYGQKIAPEQSDIDAAERVAEALESCVEYADGDSAIFTQELQRIMIDTNPVRKTNRR